MKELLKVPQLAKYLMVNPQTVYNWVNQKRIPFIKIGDLLRFDKEKIDKWLESKTFKPI